MRKAHPNPEPRAGVLPLVAAATIAVYLGAAGGALAAQDPIGTGPSPLVLFRNGADFLDASERLSIFTALGLAPAGGGEGFVDAVCGQPALAQANVLDLNGDGIPEVLAVFGNTCTSGFAGSTVAVLVGDAQGYTAHLLAEGAAAEPLESGNLGYPDLRVGVPGFCFPVWRWNGLVLGRLPLTVAFALILPAHGLYRHVTAPQTAPTQAEQGVLPGFQVDGPDQHPLR